MTPTLELLPGLRLIFESDQYQIKEESESGFITVVNSHNWRCDSEGTFEGQRIKFHLVNTLCTVDEMTLFNRYQLIKKVARGYEKIDNQRVCVHVHFNYERTGIRT